MRVSPVDTNLLVVACTGGPAHVYDRRMTAPRAPHEARLARPSHSFLPAHLLPSPAPVLGGGWDGPWDGGGDGGGGGLWSLGGGGHAQVPHATYAAFSPCGRRYGSAPVLY